MWKGILLVIVSSSHWHTYQVIYDKGQMCTTEQVPGGMDLQTAFSPHQLNPSPGHRARQISIDQWAAMYAFSIW